METQTENRLMNTGGGGGGGGERMESKRRVTWKHTLP